MFITFLLTFHEKSTKWYTWKLLEMSFFSNSMNWRCDEISILYAVFPLVWKWRQTFRPINDTFFSVAILEKNTNLFEPIHQDVQLVPRRRVFRSTKARRRRHPRSFRHHLPRRRRRRPAGTWCLPPEEAPVRGRTDRRLRGIQRWRNSPRNPRNPPVDASHRPVAAPRRPSTYPPDKTSWFHLPPRSVHSTDFPLLWLLPATSSPTTASPLLVHTTDVQDTYQHVHPILLSMQSMLSVVQFHDEYILY